MKYWQYFVGECEAAWLFEAEERSEKRQAAAAAMAKMGFAQKEACVIAVTMACRPNVGGKNFKFFWPCI
jgi:hypothetical protein